MSKVLILEDDPLIALDMAMTLEADLGVDVVLAETLAKVATLDATSLDAAVLDINIGPHTSYALARALLNEDVPVIFASGSQKADVPEDLRNLPFLSKPCCRSQMRKCIQAAISAKNVKVRLKPA
jgi:DNA-binding response OmpR family regulator